MPQVIEVRFIDPTDGIAFFDRMVLPASKTPLDKQQREAIEMGLDFFCEVQGGIELKEMVLRDEKYGRSGDGYWQYAYSCTLGLEYFGDKDREILAVLFTQYRRPDMVGKEVQLIPAKEL